MDRTRVLAHRLHVQQLHRPAPTAARDLAVVDLGVPDVPHGSAGLALAARGADPGDEEGLTLVWAARGAPHLHRDEELAALAAALWPLSDADAGARIRSSQVPGAAALGVEAVRTTAEAFAAVVTRRLPKGEVSAAVTARVPDALGYDCGPCGARHVAGTVFQLAALAGGVRLHRAGPGTALEPLPGWPGVPARAAGTAELLRTWLHLHGPATAKEAAAWLGTTQAHVRPVWPGGLATVSVAGRRAQLPEEDLDALLGGPPARGVVRLLPPGDPWLQARDRELVLPDAAHRKQVWRVIANPGALLVDGEVAGTWRAKTSGRRLDVALSPFAPLPRPVLRAVEEELALVAAARGAGDARLSVTG
ncbi:crosslink repair DNA glycosylase YcaQ family protein [Kineococcus glutinatus]|uniref:Crosslink repair DNA glycosylase YcaQ family protein n=1 Tax=Kineococcus glutinatus TaxID=1070872 RepID=A0ABP9IBA7_9ACTN